MSQLDIFECIEIAQRGLDGKPPTTGASRDEQEDCKVSAIAQSTCNQCGTELLTPADLCGFCAINEQRADRGVRAAEAATRQYHPDMENPIVSVIEDTLSHLAHACDRFGLDASTMFRDGLRQYRRHLAEDGPKAKYRADGDHLTLSDLKEMPCERCSSTGCCMANANTYTRSADAKT